MGRSAAHVAIHPTIAGHGDQQQEAMLTTLVLATAAVLPQQDADTAPAQVPNVSQAAVYDDMTGYVRPSDIGASYPSNFGSEGPGSLPQERTYLPKMENGSIAPTLSGLSLRNTLRKVQIEQAGAGQVWARGRDYRASFGVEGFTMWPVFGKQSPQEFPVAFSLAGATLGGEALVTSPDAPSTVGSTVEINQGSLREVYYLDLDQVEQTFVFDQLPGQGDLVVTLDVNTELEVLEDSSNIRFVHPEFGEVTYGQAFVRDASGRKVPIERTWGHGGITLTVPANYVASAQLPLVIDPPITSFVNNFGVNDDNTPDITWDGRANLWWVVWEDYTSAQNSDCGITNFTHGGVQGETYTIDVSNDYWTNPRIAYNYGPERLLIVASVEDGGVGGSGTIQGRLFDTGALATVAPSFIISSIGFRKLYPDVGGTNYNSIANSNFCVVWSFENGPADHDAQYRVIDSTGMIVTNIITVDGVGNDEFHTTISDTWGDSTLVGDYWTMAWTEDTGTQGDGLGKIMARQVVWSGNPAFTGGNITISVADGSSFPSVTSRMDRNLIANGERPAIVAYQRQFGIAPNDQRSIYANVMTSDTKFESVALSFTLEDVDSTLDQRDACIATDGDAFYMVYSEEYFGNVGSGDFDMYMLSGHVTETSNGVRLALAERHQHLASSSNPERFGRVATKWDGEIATNSDDACAIWVNLNSSTGGLIEGSTLEIPTLNFSAETAVGAQLCDANANGGTDPHAAENSSWVWMEGTQSIGDLHDVHCVDVTPNQFGYLLASPTATNINMPGGSAGRLCVSAAGRYTSQVQSSGPDGTFTTSVNPINIPQPMGSVFAAPGETWYFQYWHRDFINGMSTSNFSNAVKIVFNP
ncbi:MAG: hypothetical protein ACI8QC_000099 [Planctomycetota bacterium]|jgi:hypothetical protein